MANEFVARNGIIAKDNSTITGTLAVSGNITMGGALVATRTWVTGTALTGYATESYVTTAINNLIDSAPGALNTLNELAAALGDDPNFATTITNSIGTKLSLSGGTMTGNIGFNTTGTGLSWTMNTDGAYIMFYNTGDGDTNSRLEYGTSDNGNEFHRWMISTIEEMTLKSDGLRVTDSIWMGGNLVATQSWVTSQNYLTSYTNTYVTSATFNTSTGVLTLTRNDAGTITVDLDGKYAEAAHTHSATDITSGTLAAARLSGNYAINVTGSAATLTTARTLTIGNTGKTFNGGGDVAWTLAEIGAYAETNPSGYITSSGNTSGYSGTLLAEDNRTISPSELTAVRLKFGFTSWANNNTAPYADFLHLRSYTDASGGLDNLVMFRKDAIGMRIYQQTFGSTTAYSTFKDVAFTDSSITGNAATATTLQTARTLTIGNTGKTFNGSVNVSWSLAEIGAQPAGSYLTAEADTLATVTGRGRLTSSFGSAVWDETIQGTDLGNIQLDTVSTDNAGGAITWKSSDGGTGAQAGIYVRSDGSYGTKMYIATSDNYSVGSKTAISIDHSGFVNVTRGNDRLKVNGNTVWHAGNDGSGSGLDADLLDGQQGSYYLDWTNVTNKPDPVITLAGDATGSATFTDLGNATLTVTVVDDSHTHDGRYYTETESDARFVNVTGDTVTGDLTVSGAALGVISTTAGSDAFYVDGVNGRLFTVTDSLDDSLFSVNTIAGLPVIEAFADNTVKLGPFTNPVTISSTGILSIGGLQAATQSYVNTAIANLVNSAPSALDTLQELATALGNDASFSTTVSTALGNRLRIDTASQGLNGTQQANGRTNLGLGTAATSNVGDFATSGHTHSAATTSAAGFMSAADKTKLDGIAAGATANVGTVTSVSGTGSYGGLTLSGTVTSSGSITLGGTPTGTWPISVSGNAATATSATTATSAATWTTARTLTIGSTGKSVNGSADVAWTLTEIGAAAASHNHTSLTGVTSIGFAAEASDVASISTTISGTSTFFDFNLTDDNNNDEWRWRFTPSGATVYNAMRLIPVTNTTANLVVSGTIAASNFSGTSSGTNTGDQTTISGNAGSATVLQTARTFTIGATGKTFDGSANVSWTLAEIGALGATAKAADSELLDGIDSSGFVRQLSDGSSPDYQTPSSRRVNPNASNPTNEHYAVTTFGNGSNVTGQLATHFQTGNLYSRGYNSTWSAWRRYWNDTDFTSTNVSNWNTAYLWGNHAGLYLGISDTAADSNKLGGIAAASYYLASNPSGYITSSSNITGTSAGVVSTVSGTNSAELVRGNMGDNDQARILVGATASNAGYLEIATADDGTEPIYVRQYTGVFSTLTRTATILDGSGNTTLPGNLTVGGTITENSSIRYKENIVDLEFATEKVEQLRPVRYNKIGTEQEEIGLIAEEVAEIYPEVVTYNEEGQPDGVNYTRLSVILLKSVQELAERINKLENK